MQITSSSSVTLMTFGGAGLVLEGPCRGGVILGLGAVEDGVDPEGEGLDGTALFNEPGRVPRKVFNLAKAD